MSGGCYVYVIFRLDGSPCYVGKGSGDRWRHHFRRKNPSNPALRLLIDEAGGELPVVIIRRGLTHREALKVERLFIWAIGRESLLNRVAGGGGGRKMSPETRRRMSESKKGVKKSEAHQAAITAAITGLPKTPEHLANFRRARLGVPVKAASDERKEKVRQRTLEYWKRWRAGGIARRMNNGQIREATDRGTADSPEREVRP